LIKMRLDFLSREFAVDPFLHQIQTTARRFCFRACRQIGRAGGKAHAAMDAGFQAFQTRQCDLRSRASSRRLERKSRGRFRRGKSHAMTGIVVILSNRVGHYLKFKIRRPENALGIVAVLDGFQQVLLGCINRDVQSSCPVPKCIARS
jgi:hypothetical protein